LKSKAVMWLWELRDIGIIAIGAIVSIVALTQVGIYVLLLITAVYAFLAIRLDDTSILKFLKNSYSFFIGKMQVYEWRLTEE